MYCAGLKGDCAATNIDSSSLPNKEGARFWLVPGRFFHRGGGRKCQESSKGEHIPAVDVIKGDAITRESISNQSVPGSFFRRGLIVIRP